MPLLLCEHTRNKAAYATGASVRIYDPRQALAGFAYEGAGAFEFALEDGGAYRVSYEGGKATVHVGVSSARPGQLKNPAPVTLTRTALVLLVSGQLKDAMALQSCPGVHIAAGAEVDDIVRAFRCAALPMLWDGF